MTDAVFGFDSLSETVDLEVKRAEGRDGRGELPNSIWETYSAFANTDGGVILLGVTESDGDLVATGLDEPDGVLLDLWNQVNNPQKVSRNLLSDAMVTKTPTAGGRWIVAIDVPRASRKERPVFINGNPITGTYKRQHSGDFHCSEEEVKRMLAEQMEDERDAKIFAGYDLADIDMDSFKAYRSRLAARKPDHPYNSADDVEFLRKVGGWRKDRTADEEGLTLAGLLMFGASESIQEVVRNYFVDYRELPASGTTTDWVDRLTPDGTWSGNLYDFYRSVIQRLFRDLKVPFRLEGAEREDETPVHKALREALVNAIIHGDYSASVSVLVVKAPHYFGFRNPGRMRIPIEKALEGGHSDCRNRSLQKMFSLIGLGEQAGSGIPRVVENWRTQHYRFPELWESQDPEATLMRLRTVSLLPNESLEELRKLFGGSFDALGDNGRLAMATAQIEGFVTNARMQQICDLHPRDITTLLKTLEEEGMLVHDGHGRGTTYRLAGTEAVDLAGAVDFSDHAQRAKRREDSPLHKEESPLHKGLSPLHNKSVLDDPELMQIAEPVRSKPRVSPETTQRVIVSLCRGRFLSVQQLAELLNRSHEGLRQRFIKPMTDQGLLDRRFPQQPSHEQQAYRSSESRDE